MDVTYDIYVDLIDTLEELKYYKSQNQSCEVMLSRHNLYPSIGGALNPEHEALTETDIILWLLFLSDGEMPIQLIAKKLNVKMAYLQHLVDKLVASGLLSKV